MVDTAPPFDGVRVVDLSETVAGMTATMLFADLGADVVRFDDRDADVLPGEVTWQRGKRITGRDADLERDLITGCDILVTSDPSDAARFSPLLRDLPRVIHLDLSALQSTAHGPLAYEAMLGAVSGASLRQSSYDGGPVDLVVPFFSYEQGMWGAAVAAAALVERERSGLGQHVLVDDQHSAVLATTATGIIDPNAPAPISAVGPSGPSPHYSPYLCADGKWLFLAALLPKFQRAAFRLLGVPQILTDPRVAGDGSKLHLRSNLPWIKELIEGAMATRPREEWLRELAASDVPCSTIGEPEDWLDHPQMAAIDQRIELDDPRVGPALAAAFPVEFASTPTSTPRAREFTSRIGWKQPALVPAGHADNADAAGPLAGVRVLDLGAVVAGPLAGRLLAGLGAEVIKVEPLEGDSFRKTGFQNNLGQRSLAIDLRAEEGHATFLALVAMSDVVVDNFRPGVAERLHITHATLQPVKDTVITMSISGFGVRGPIGADPGFDPVLQAMSGMMAIQGGDTNPVFHTLAPNDITAAAATVLGTCAALFVRERRHIGQHVATSLAAISAYMLSGEVLQYASRPPVPRGGADFRGPALTSRYYQTSDGWVRVHVRGVDQLVDAGLVADGSVDSEAAVAAGCLSTTSDDLIIRIERAGGLAVRARTVADVAADRSMIDGRYLDELVRGDGKVLLIPGVHSRFSRTDLAEHLRPPGLGEHTSEILGGIGIETAAVDRLVAAGVVRVGAPMDDFDVSNYR